MLFYLVFRYSRQSIYGCNMPTWLALIRQCIHNGLHGSLVFSRGWWKAHHRRHIWNKRCDFQLRKVHSCMLTWAPEYYTGQQVNKLITCLQAHGKLVINVTFSHRETIFVDINQPGPQLFIPRNIFIWLIENGDKFLYEIRDGFPHKKSVIPKELIRYSQENQINTDVKKAKTLKGVLLGIAHSCLLGYLYAARN